MLIRTEAPADILPIQRLVSDVFPGGGESDLVMQLRENGQRTLSLVACNDDGELVGHAMFSPVMLNNTDLNWQGLAPVSVREDYRNRGIGSQLIREGLESLAELGYPVCVVLGDPKYYGRFGFESATAHQLRCQWEVPEGAFQVMPLLEGELSGHSGLIKYSDEFLALT